MSRAGSSSRRGFTFISWKKSPVPKSVVESGPPLCPDWERARSATMSRRTKSARSCSSRTVIPRCGMESFRVGSRPGQAFASGALSRYRMERAARNQIPPSGVVVASLAGIGDHPGADRARDLLDAVPDATRGAEAPLPLDSIEAHPVGPAVLLLGLNDHAHAGHMGLQLFLEIEQLVVLEVVAEIQDRGRVSGQRSGEGQDDAPRDVRNVDEGAPLRAPEDRDRPLAHRLLRQEIHGKVEPHPGRDSVHGAEAEYHGLEARIARQLEDPLLS